MFTLFSRTEIVYREVFDMNGIKKGLSVMLSLVMTFSVVCNIAVMASAESETDVSQDGVYKVSTALWHEVSNYASMGNKAFEEYPQSVIITDDGVSTLYMRTNPVAIGPIRSGLQNMRFTNKNDQIQYVTQIDKKSMMAVDTYGAEHELEYVSIFSLRLSSVTEEYIPVSIQVPYTPMDAISENVFTR